MTHEHKIQKTKELPFGGIELQLCACGARKRSDGNEIAGGYKDSQGWYCENPVDNSREDYDLLQNEGHDPNADIHHPVDYFRRQGSSGYDPIDSHHPNID